MKSKCIWLIEGKTHQCGCNAVGDYCTTHDKIVKRGSKGPQPCIVCGIGVRGKYALCTAHGSKKYRALRLYYQTYHKQDLSVHDYVERVNIKKSHQRDQENLQLKI